VGGALYCVVRFISAVDLQYIHNFTSGKMLVHQLLRLCIKLVAFLILLLSRPTPALIEEKIVHCELEALKIGTRLADIYNGPVEDEEWDIRVHQEVLMEHLGFAPWMANGVYKSGGKTPKGLATSVLRERGGWAGRSNVSESPYWALADSWLYLMGDSTTRQLWGAFATPFNGNNFERNAKEWSRENCDRQFPHRKKHPPEEGHFTQEGWGGKCGNNEVTCNIPGFGSSGVISFGTIHLVISASACMTAYIHCHHPPSLIYFRLEALRLRGLR
jgi:hypothetical protein